MWGNPKGVPGRYFPLAKIAMAAAQPFPGTSLGPPLEHDPEKWKPVF
jgi:hypothetical protein